MTKKQKLIVKLESLIGSGDIENAHSQADKALIVYINDPEITEAYNKIHKWYA